MAGYHFFQVVSTGNSFRKGADVLYACLRYQKEGLMFLCLVKWMENLGWDGLGFGFVIILC